MSDSKITIAGNVFHKEESLSDDALKALFAASPDQLSLAAYKRVVVLYKAECDYRTAINVYFKMLERHSAFVKQDVVFYNIAACYFYLGDFTQSLLYMQKAFSIQDKLYFHWNYALLLLAMGNYAEGWKEYEHRFEINDQQPLGLGYDLSKYNSPRWDGSDLNHKTLLVHPEQGYGDNIQFIRFIKLIKQRYPYVKLIMASGVGLRRLFSSFSDIDAFCPFRKNTLPYDYHVSLLSLPYHFQIHDEKQLMPEPYLKADPEKIKKWLPWFANVKDYKIGVCWSGATGYSQNQHRNCNLEDFLFLQNLPNTTVYSLQKKLTDKDRALLATTKIINCGEKCITFADTAAVIEQLDLVISIDTAVMHLAGALGKPVYLLLSYFTEWRHPQSRTHSPWYPSVTFIRQSAPNDWASVFEKLKDLF